MKGLRWDKPTNPWTIPAGSVVLSYNADRADWLEARRSMICGSDIAAVLGASKYRDAFGVWADKTGRAPEREATDVMVRGTILEDGVVELWADRYYDEPIELRRQGLVRSRKHPHAGATVDRLSICPLGRCIVEVKTQVDMTEWEGDEVPTDYQLQGQWQLAVTGREHIHFVVLGPRLVPHHRIMYRDVELGEQLLTGVADDWWSSFVDADVPPSPSAQSLDLLRSMYGNPAVGAKFVLADDDEAADLFRSLARLRADREAAAKQYDDVVAQLQAKVGNATEIVWDFDDTKPVATWRPTRTIDGVTKDFRRANVDLVAPFVVPVTSEEVDVAKLAENHPELLDTGALRYRRSFLVK